MDRLRSLRLPRLLLPLAGVILACLPLLVFRPAGQQGDRAAVGLAQPTDQMVGHAHPTPAATTPGTGAALAEGRPAVLGKTLPETAKPLKPALAAGDPAVLAAAFPCMPASAEPAAAGNGPELPAPGLPVAGSRPAAAAPAPATPPGPLRALSHPRASLLLPPEAATTRSEQLERTARQADQQVRHGFEMANRRAYYAARAEFIAALRLVAQGLDVERHTINHSRSLSAGLTALKEAGDFLPAGGKLEADLDLPAIIASHRTPVLKNTAAENLVPMLALKAYFTFAQEQLSAAAGHEVAGSMALYALGKLHATVARQRSLDLPAAAPKAVVFYQASLLVCPRNYLAANDLGVVLAESGYYSEARSALEHSIRISWQSANLGNLAVVYGQLGQPRLAQQARQQAEAVRRAEVQRLRARQISAGGAVQWVDPRVLAETGVETPDPPAPAPAKKSLSGVLPRPAGEACEIRLCQALGPAAPYDICGVDCAASGCYGNGCWRGWEDARFIAWQQYAQGEYVGPCRLAHVRAISAPRGRPTGHDLPHHPRRDAHALPAERGRRDPRRIVHRFGTRPQPADPARRHDHAAAAGPGPCQRPHRDPAARHPGRTVQEVLQGAGDHGHAAEGQHAAGRPARLDRPPGGHRRPEPDGSRHARRG